MKPPKDLISEFLTDFKKYAHAVNFKPKWKEQLVYDRIIEKWEKRRDE